MNKSGPRQVVHATRLLQTCAMSPPRLLTCTEHITIVRQLVEERGCTVCLDVSGSVSRRLAWGANSARLGFARSLSRGLVGSQAMNILAADRTNDEMGQIISD